MTLKWKKISGATGYEIQCLVDDFCDVYETLGTVTGLTFVHEDLQPGHKYTYRVRALAENETASGDYGTEKSGTIKCGKPAVTIGLDESGKPMLSWEAVEGATQYQIYYAASKNGKYKKLDPTEELSFVYEAAKKGKTCYFKVCGVDVNGTTGDYSSVKSIKSK